ncbi:hypothetical protein J3B02_000718 [Coemansia erecta]|nr:hypothetical protein J3B02_000718 [Coemansia erecta]
MSLLDLISGSVSAASPTTQLDPETAFWNELQRNLESILESKGKYTPKEYTDLYTRISTRLNHAIEMGSSYGSSSSSSSNSKTSIASDKRGIGASSGNSSSIMTASQRGSQLYYWLTNFMTGHLQKLAKKVLEYTEVEALKFYISEWEKYMFAAKLVRGVFLPLQRQWLVGEKRCNSNFSFVQETMEQLWYFYLFKPVSDQIMSNVIKLVSKKRAGMSIEDNFIAALAYAFSQLKPENTPEAYARYRENLGTYLLFIEGPYVQAAVRHVQAAVSHIKRQDNVCEYLRTIDTLMQREEMWGSQLLLPESSVVLSCMLNKHFIDDRIEYIVRELPQVFMSNSKDDLRLAYRLLDRVRDLGHLSPLSRAFGHHVHRDIVSVSPAPTVTEGIKSAETNAAYTSSFIDTILDTMDAHRQLLAECFESNSDFAESMTRGFRQVINSKDLRDRCQSVPMKLLAEYFHQVARASSGDARQAGASSVDPEATIKDKLQRAIKLYEFAKGKDNFLSHYALHLARRLLLEQTVSLELERSIVAMIGLLGGMEMTVKLKEMLTDIDTSEDMSRGFSQAVAMDPSVSVSDVNVKVLKTASWPAAIQSESSEWTTPPPQLAHICAMFSSAYNARHSASDQQRQRSADAKRKLRWLWEYSKCSVQFFFPHSTGRVAKSGYTFVLNTFQLAILMLFTETSGLGANYNSPTGPVFTPEQICSATNIAVDIVKAELTIFARAGILVRLPASNTFRLNHKFNSKRLRIDISAIKRVRRAKEEDRVTKNTVNDRLSYLKADIARYMKARKTMTYRQLFEEVASSRSRIFEVTRHEFKKALDSAIEMDIVKRHDEDFNKLLYVS